MQGPKNPIFRKYTGTCTLESSSIIKKPEFSLFRYYLYVTYVYLKNKIKQCLKIKYIYNIYIYIYDID